jgi:hypothetical protein
VSGVPSHRREPELGSLPLVLVGDLGSRHLIATPGAFEDGLDDGPLVLQGVAGREVELDVQMPYVRGISRSS